MPDEQINSLAFEPLNGREKELAVAGLVNAIAYSEKEIVPRDGDKILASGETAVFLITRSNEESPGGFAITTTKTPDSSGRAKVGLMWVKSEDSIPKAEIMMTHLSEDELLVVGSDPDGKGAVDLETWKKEKGGLLSENTVKTVRIEGGVDTPAVQMVIALTGENGLRIINIADSSLEASLRILDQFGMENFTGNMTEFLKSRMSGEVPLLPAENL